VPEVITDGLSGFVVDSIPEAVEAVGRVAGLCRRACRDEFERRFDAARMARDYVDVYRHLAHGKPEAERPASAVVVSVSSPLPKSLDRRRPFRSPAPLLGALRRVK
jgi:hypothetical protein